MKYLKKYGITEDEIKELEDFYNENIIKFLKENEIFITEKLDYLKEEGYNIYPILRDNIKVFLEIITAMERKIEKMKEKNFSKKEIQAVLENERLYDRIK